MMAVYVATASTRKGQVKIGITKNPDGRVGTLAAKCKGRVQMPFVLWLDTDRAARKLESDAHWQMRLYGSHVEGEWFRGTPQSGVWAIYSALKKDATHWNGPDFYCSEIPLIEWGIGFLFAYKPKVCDWAKVTRMLEKIERNAA